MSQHTASPELNPRYAILFEPVRIGPVTAPNRFYQVPHASGMTNALPHVRARFRETKAEGGWGVVCTGAVSIHPSSDDAPLPFATLWDENDVRSHAIAVDAVHRHGSLAGVELWHGGASVMNRASRLPPLSPSGIPWMATHVGFMGNQRPRAMDEGDIGSLLAVAGRGRAQGAARRIRHHLRLCGHGVSSVRVLVAGVQPAHGCLRRLDRKSRAPRTAAHRGNPRSGRRQGGGGIAHQSRGAARQAGAMRRVRGARSRDAARRTCRIYGTSKWTRAPPIARRRDSLRRRAMSR